MNGLLLSMPGTPVIYYGDEIGMGDNIFIGDRDGVRTPMQWSVDRNGGFSRADPAKLVLPPIMDPIYGFQAVNVEAQASDPAFAAELDAHGCWRCAQQHIAFRPRHAAFPVSRQPQSAGVSARAHAAGRDGRIVAVRQQPVAQRAGGGAGPVGVRWPGAGGYRRRIGLPRRGPADLLADLAALRVLLVPTGGRRATAVLAYAAAGSRCRSCRPSCCAGRSRKCSPAMAVHVLETESLPVYLPKRRWYASRRPTRCWR